MPITHPMAPGAPLIPVIVLFSASQWAVILGALFVGLTLHATLVFLFHRDVKAMGRPPLKWTIAAALLYVPTLLVWWAARPRVSSVLSARRATTERPMHPRMETVPNQSRHDTDPYGLGLDAPVETPRPQWDDVRETLTDPPATHPRTTAGTTMHYATRTATATCTQCGETNRIGSGAVHASPCDHCGAMRTIN
jgi:hypothetical protein